MAKVTKADRSKRETVVVSTGTKAKDMRAYNWWQAKSKGELNNQLMATVAFLKERQGQWMRKAAVHARLYGNMPLANFVGSTLNKLASPQALPIDRPTMNVVQSCIDTLVSRISQSKPKPTFLTDGGNYTQRKLSKQMNNFIAGELYQTRAYEKVETMLRHAAILGTGVLKVLEDNKRMSVENVLPTELLVDEADGAYMEPRCIYQLKLVDRSVLAHMFPEERSKVQQAEQAYLDDSGDSSKTSSDQVMIVEAWRLPSAEDAGDGRRTIACTAGLLLDEPYEKSQFPFVFLRYSPGMLGFWAQGLAEQLLGTQVEINKLLITISQSINLVGVPRVFVEDGSKVVKAHLNNNIGSIVTYRGTKPEYEVAPCVPQELYAQLQRLIDYSYQQSGVSALAAASQKPAGLNSGEAIRNYDDLQTDRFATLNKRYNRVFEELGYLLIDGAADIAKRDGKYETVYPSKNGAQQVDLPDVQALENAYVIQCFDSSSLPKDPAGRLQKVTEMMQAGILSPQEGRRLLDFPDLEQVERLENAAEERILQILDAIVEDGKYTPPDPFMDMVLANKLVVQYYNLYQSLNLPESRSQMLRDFHSQLQTLQMAAQPPMAAPGMPGGIAQPMAPPTSDLMPIQ